MNRRGLLKGFGAAFGCALCAPRQGFAAEGAHWSYEGAGGPAHWGELDASSRVCSTGVQQSPLDIVTSTRAELPKLKLSWKPLAGRILNNGHTIQVDAASGGGMEAGSERYELVQFHFHAPSEHKVDGRTYPMEVHFVHRDTKTGGLGVLGVFMAEGRRNAAFAALMEAMPREAGKSVDVPARIDIKALVPRLNRYWAYEGSLTTPPCSEVVDWRVCVEPIQVAAVDIRRFTELYPMNARPIQEVQRRFVLKSR